MEKRMIEGVRCTVSSCEYWASQNRCQAGQILITHASPVIAADKHGAQAEMLQQTPAETLEQTCCYTFEPRE